jgi:hypothetical protein
VPAIGKLIPNVSGIVKSTGVVEYDSYQPGMKEQTMKTIYERGQWIFYKSQMKHWRKTH